MVLIYIYYRVVTFSELRVSWKAIFQMKLDDWHLLHLVLETRCVYIFELTDLVSTEGSARVLFKFAVALFTVLRAARVIGTRRLLSILNDLLELRRPVIVDNILSKIWTWIMIIHKWMNKVHLWVLLLVVSS